MTCTGHLLAMSYDWCKLLKHYSFQWAITVCDLGATPCWWSSVLLKLCGEMLQVYDMNNSTIMGNGIVHPSLTYFKLLCSFKAYLIHAVH